MALQIRRGTSADVTSASFVPLLGEPLYLTDNQKLYIGDGSTQGGNAIGGAEDLKELTSVTLIDEAVGALDLYSVTSNTVLVTLSVGQSAYYVGLQVVISNSSVSALNGTHTITSIPTGSQFTFSLTTADVTSASVTGVVTPKIPNGDALIWNDTNSYWENAAVLTDIVNDITPQLGGNLDTNNKTITSTGTNNIEFDPATGQNVIFRGNSTDGSGRIVLNCEVNTHGVTIQGPPHSAAATYDLVLPNDMGTSGYVLSTDGTSATSWIAPPATTLDGLTDVNVPSPTDGQVLIYSTTNSRWEAGQAASPVLHTTFDFAYSGTTPTGTVASSTRLGRNYGTWTEVTSAVAYGPSSSTYDPTLQGVTFSSSTGKFTGFPAGRYHIICSFNVSIDNVTPGFGSTLAHFLNANNVASTFGYASHLCNFTPLPYASYGSAAYEFPVNLDLFAVFEETTGSNNQFEVFGDQDMSPSYYITYGNLNIIKMADL